MSQKDIVTFRGRTAWQVTTAVGTLTAGAYSQLTVAGNSAAVFGGEVSTISTLFSRYRVPHLRVRVWTFPSSTNRYWGVKYVPENAGTPGTVTALRIMDGDMSAFQASPSTKPAELALSGKELDVSGIQWRECDDAAENFGTYGVLTAITEAAGFAVIEFEWTIEFAGFAYSGIHLSPPALRAVLKGSPKAVLSTLKSLKEMRATQPEFAPPLAPIESEKKDDYETVVVREVVQRKPGFQPGSWEYRTQRPG